MAILEWSRQRSVADNSQLCRQRHPCQVRLREVVIDNIHSLAAPAHSSGQTEAAEFNHHVQKLERAAIHCLVELEVDCPHMVGVFSSNAADV